MRNIQLEEALQNPSTLSVSSRQPNLNQPIRNIPFGIRGRRRCRRNTYTVIRYIGMRCNPDHSEYEEAPLVQVIETPEPTPTRTYGRVALGPRRLTFGPEESPPRNVVSPTAEISEPYDLDYEILDEMFGQLTI